MGESPGRKVKDKLTRFGVTAGGIFVLLTLVLIFFYLLYVILPIFSSVKVTPLQTFSTSFSDRTAVLTLSDQNDHAFRLSTDGTLSIVQVAGSHPGKVIEQQRLLPDVTSIARTLPADGIFAVGGAHGDVAVAKPTFTLSPEAASVAVTYPLDDTVLTLDPEHQPSSS
ncbi:phosphate transport system permease protein PstC [Photobacterium aphoticum]|uniref:Phosphate transport system permease protein PstC n=1 Tax=Photobacterium aphoticum TaxID=754436 RepID=A0A090RM84_9GAMM|nr:phosphate transport system permease protein PstC [Photobacterium aphoticum]